MKIYINQNGLIEKVEEAGLISGSWGRNYIDFYYQEDVSYVALNGIRNDSFEIRNLLIPKTQRMLDTENNLYFWRYEVLENDPLINVAGQLQLSANFVKLTDLIPNVKKEYVVATTTYTTKVFKSVGSKSEEEYNDFIAELQAYRDEVMLAFEKIAELQIKTTQLEEAEAKGLKIFTIGFESVSEEILQDLIKYGANACIYYKEPPADNVVCYFLFDTGTSLIYQGRLATTEEKNQTLRIEINKTTKSVTHRYYDNSVELGYKYIEEYQATNEMINTTFDSLDVGIYIVNTFIYGQEIWMRGNLGKKRITNIGILERNETTKDWTKLYVENYEYKKLFAEDGKIKTEYIPSIAITQTYVVSSIEEMLQLTAQTGDVAIISGVGSYILKGNDPKQLDNWVLLSSPTDSVLSVNGKTGSVTLNLEDLPDSEQKLNQVKEEAVAEALEQIGNVNVQTKTSPTRDFIVNDGYINELDSEGNIINIFDTQIESIQTTDTDSEVYGKLMEYFRTLFGLGIINIGFNVAGKQGARGRFLCHPDYFSSDFGEALSYYFEYKSHIYQEEVDSFVVECIGAKESEAECTMTIDLYDKSGDYYRLQVYCYLYDGVSTYYSKGWEKQTNKLELLDFSNYDIGEDLGYIGEEIYNNPTRYLIKIKRNNYDTYLHYKGKNEEYGETWWEYQIIAGEDEYIETGAIYINKDGEWGVDESFKVIVTNVFELIDISTGNKITRSAAIHLLQNEPIQIIINAQIAGYNAPFVYANTRNGSLNFQGSVVDAQLGIVASSYLIINSSDWSWTLEETTQTITSGSSSESNSNIINISSYEDGDVLDDEHFSAISENPKNVLLVHQGTLCGYVYEEDDLYFYIGSSMYTEDSIVEELCIYIDKTTHVLTIEYYGTSFPPLEYVDKQLSLKPEIINVGDISSSSKTLTSEVANKLRELGEKAIVVIRPTSQAEKVYLKLYKTDSTVYYYNGYTVSSNYITKFDFYLKSSNDFKANGSYAGTKYSYLRPTDIATINGQAITNGGDITIEGGAGAKVGITLNANGTNYKGRTLYFDTTSSFTQYLINFQVVFKDKNGSTTGGISGTSEMDETGIPINQTIYFENLSGSIHYLIYSESTGWAGSEYELPTDQDYILYAENITDDGYLNHLISVADDKPIVVVDNIPDYQEEMSEQKNIPTTSAVKELTDKKFEEASKNSIVDVEALPNGWKGTAVPTSGYVEKVYINTNLSGEEVLKMLPNSDYTFFVDDNREHSLSFSVADKNISDQIYGVSYFINGVWQEIDPFDNPIEVNCDLEGDRGAKNEKYSSLVSITPFEEDPININAIYRLPDGTLWMYQNEWKQIGGNVGGNVGGNGDSLELSKWKVKSGKFITNTLLQTEENIVMVPETIQKTYIKINATPEELMNQPIKIIDSGGSMGDYLSYIEDGGYILGEYVNGVFDGYFPVSLYDEENSIYKIDIPGAAFALEFTTLENPKAYIVEPKQHNVKIDLSSLAIVEGAENHILISENGNYLISSSKEYGENTLLYIHFGVSTFNKPKTIFLGDELYQDSVIDGLDSTDGNSYMMLELKNMNNYIYFIKVTDDCVYVTTTFDK